MTRWLRRIQWHQVVLAGILLVGLVLRVNGLNWDQGLYLHPDERFIAMVSSGRVSFPDFDDLGSIFDPANSPINPRRDDESGNPQSFAYGTLPIYVQGVASWVLDLAGGDDFGSYDRLYIVGRALTVLVDLVTILLVYFIGRRIFGVPGGLAAAALYALLVLPIQLSHFFTTDPWLTMFVTATLLFILRYLERPTIGRSLAVGAAIGCAFATKTSVPSLLIPVAAVYAVIWYRSETRTRIAEQVALGALASLAVFTLFEPYAIVRFSAFFDDIQRQADIVRGNKDVPYTRQFVGLIPGIYELKNHFLYASGPAFTIAAIVATGWAAWRAIRYRSVELGVLVLWIVAYIPILITTEARFLRYSLPLLPILAVLVGGLLWTLMLRLDTRRLGQAATIVTLGITAIWAIGFSTIYQSEHPRIHASEWIYKNVEPGSTLTFESWDDALPLPVNGNVPGVYSIQSMDIYGDRPPEEKVRQLYDDLQGADYVVLSSDRVRQSIQTMPWRYAVQGEYYRRLLNGQLGYRLVYQSELHPHLFGITWDDTNADESFTVYDHPTVRIFKQVEELSFEDFRARLLWGINQPWEPTRYPSREWLRLDQPVDTIETSDNARYSDFLVDHGWAAAIAWLIVVEAIGLAALPAASWVFRRSPDRGALSSRMLGLLAIGWLTWIGPSLNLWSATTAAAFVSLIALAGVSWWLFRRRRRESPWHLPSLQAWLTAAGLYLGVFGLFLLLRAIYPDFWQTYLGGEKPFELAYLRAIASSVDYPPYDPWFSGGIINYYYYGWHLIATLARLSGVGVSNAFQLGMPLVAALLASQTAAAALAIIGSQHVERARRHARYLLPAGLAVILVMFIGNLDPVRQLIEYRFEITTYFNFWAPTRVIPFTINEFPFFSLLWFDLHPHVLDFPILMTLVALLCGSIHHAQTRVQEDRSRLLATDPITLVVLALVLGTILVTNAWDMPLAIGLAIVGLGYAGLLAGRLRGLIGLLTGVSVCAGALLLFLPFHAHFYSVVDGLEYNLDGSPLGSFLIVWGILFGIVLAALLVAAVRTWRSYGALEDAGLFAALALITSIMGTAVRFARGADLELAMGVAALGSAIAIGAAATATRPQRFHLAILGLVTLGVLSAGLTIAFLPAAGLSIALAVACAMHLIHRWREPQRALPWSLVIVAMALIAGVEVLYIVDDLNGTGWFRMNTVFKFYLQAWLLLGLGAAVLLARLWQSTRRLERTRTALTSTVIISVAIGLLALGFSYPLMGTPARLEQDMSSSPTNLTLDGYAWMDGGWLTNTVGQKITFTGDLAAIKWLNAHASDTDVIIEAAIGPYRGNGSRISSATGLPAVMGWDRHQYQQRYPEGITERVADVRWFYNSPDPAAKLDVLRRYRVRWIIVGDVERLWYMPGESMPYASPEGIAAIEEMTGGSLRLAFESAGTSVYEVEPFPQLAPTAEAFHQL